VSAGGANVRPWTQQKRLQAERDTLGLYLSGHPIDEYLPELKQLTRDRLANLRPERESQWVAGLLVSTRTMRSKRGDNIAFITLDDRSGRLEISLFAKEYEQFRELLQKDAILVVDCQVSMDDFKGAMRGRAREVLNLTQARQRFAKAKPGVQTDAVAGYTGTLASHNPLSQKTQHVRQQIIIVRRLLHVTGLTLHVHQADPH
jgi:DNA polymerase-3 subunit alpha